jgi:DNA-binding MarR family transcriptional regulator
MLGPQHAGFINKNEHRMKSLKLFAGLRKMREFERLQLPFIKSLIDFDIIIEIGYAQEQKRTFTPKQLSKVGSVTTVRRRLAKLTGQGVVARRTNVNDHRSDLLTLTASSLKLLERYGRMLSGIGQITKDIAAAAQ